MSDSPTGSGEATHVLRRCFAAAALALATCPTCLLGSLRSCIQGMRHHPCTDMMFGCTSVFSHKLPHPSKAWANHRFHAAHFQREILRFYTPCAGSAVPGERLPPGSALTAVPVLEPTMAHHRPTLRIVAGTPWWPEVLETEVVEPGHPPPLAQANALITAERHVQVELAEENPGMMAVAGVLAATARLYLDLPAAERLYMAAAGLQRRMVGEAREIVERSWALLQAFQVYNATKTKIEVARKYWAEMLLGPPPTNSPSRPTGSVRNAEPTTYSSAGRGTIPVDFVVARCNEKSLDWLKDLALGRELWAELWVYEACEFRSPPSAPLDITEYGPPAGIFAAVHSRRTLKDAQRETLCFAQHLAEVALSRPVFGYTIFLQGYPFDHIHQDLLDDMLRALRSRSVHNVEFLHLGSVRTLEMTSRCLRDVHRLMLRSPGCRECRVDMADRHLCTLSPDNDSRPCPRDYLRAMWWEEDSGNGDIRELNFQGYYNNMFVVANSRIRGRPAGFWDLLYQLVLGRTVEGAALLRCHDRQQHWAALAAEWLWPVFFGEPSVLPQRDEDWRLPLFLRLGDGPKQYPLEREDSRWHILSETDSELLGRDP